MVPFPEGGPALEARAVPSTEPVTLLISQDTLHEQCQSVQLSILPSQQPPSVPLPHTSECANSQTLSSNRALTLQLLPLNITQLGTDVLRSWDESPHSLAERFISTIISACSSEAEELSFASQRKTPNNSQRFENPCPRKADLHAQPPRKFSETAFDL